MSANDASPPKTVGIKIAGREYKLRAGSDPQHLENVASYVDRVMQEVRRSTSDSHDAAILTALNIASDLLEMKDHLTVVPRDRIKALIDLIDSA